MFCVKCGAEIKSSDLHCSKCGAVNENYRPQKDESKFSFLNKEKQKDEEIAEKPNDVMPKKKNSKIVLLGIIVAVAMICIVIVCFSKLSFRNNYSNMEYQARGISAIVDNAGTAFFFIDGQTVSFEGDFSNGICTPDHKKFVLLNFDGTLQLYASKDSEPVSIASNAERIIKITNDGFAYTVNEQVSTEEILKKMSESYRVDKSLIELKKEFANSYSDSISDAKKFYKEKVGYIYTSSSEKDKTNVYYFKKGNTVELESSSNGVNFADNSLTFARIDIKHKLSTYVEGTDSVKELCNVGENANLCGISADGQNIIWSEEKDNELLIYTMKNNAPERIGKLGKTQKYSTYPNVIFFDKGFIVTCKEYNTLIFAKNDEVKEVTFNGVMNSYSLLDSNGNYIENDPCNTEFFYFTASKSKDGNISRLYKLDMTGNIQEIASDLSSQFYIKGNKIFYLNDDKDFYIANLESKGISDSCRITTEISYLKISDDGSTAYVVKAGGLYYWNTNDSSYLLHLINNNFGADSEIYLTESGDSIFYLTDMQEIADTYSKIGTLYYYKKGTSEPQNIASKVNTLKHNDSKNYSSTNPIIVQYSKKNSDGVKLYNIGLLNDSKMKIVIQDIIN
jgi:hypothetical protein